MTGLPIDELGLLTSVVLPAGALVGFYTGHFIDEERYTALPIPRELGSYWTDTQLALMSMS